MMWLVIYPDGTYNTPWCGEDKLKFLRDQVGGHVVPCRLPENLVMLLNEDGLPMQLSHNPHASRLAGQGVVGPAVIVSNENGTWERISDELGAELIKVLQLKAEWPIGTFVYHSRYGVGSVERRTPHTLPDSEVVTFVDRTLRMPRRFLTRLVNENM